MKPLPLWQRRNCPSIIIDVLHIDFYRNQYDDIVKHLESYKLSDRADVNQPIVGAEKLLTSHQPCAGGN
jgi:hypothetical protein